MLPLLSLAARADPPETLEPAALLGPWCLPGAPACAFDVREEGVWDEASDLVRPWTLQDRRVIFDPGGDLEQRWRIVETAADWIAAEQESTGVVLWFLRAPGPVAGSRPDRRDCAVAAAGVGALGASRKPALR